MILPQEAVLEKELTKTKSTRAKGKEILPKKKHRRSKARAREIPRVIVRKKVESPQSQTKEIEFDTLQQKAHPVWSQTEQENVSMNYVGKLNGNTISSRKYLKRCLSVCLISVLQCSINFLVPLSVAGYTVSGVLCFQFGKRTTPEVRVRQSMSTLLR